MKQKKTDVWRLATIAMLTGILLLMSFTPLGYLNIGLLAISFNMIPVAITAIVVGPLAGAVLGGVFGITSFLQCVGFGGYSAMGAILFNINPFLAFVQRFVPRVLAGLLSGYVYKGSKKLFNHAAACFITGFCAALFNTILFMASLVLLFGNTQYLQGLIGGKNIIVFICSFVGVNAIFEMIADTIVVGAVGNALYKTNIIRRTK